MELVNITDEEGNHYTYKKYKGRPFHIETPGNVEDQLKKVADFKCRPDDVCLCTYHKSGTHWMFNIMTMLLNGSTEYTGRGVTLEFHDDLNTLNQQESPRKYHSHLTYPFLPDDLKKGIGKVIHVVRNPKDTFVSSRKFFEKLKNIGYEGTTDGFLGFFLSDNFFSSGGSWFTYVKEWTDGKVNNPNLKVLSVRFEDMKNNLYGEIKRVADFLEVSHSEDFLKEVEKGVSFERLKLNHETEAGTTERWKDICEDGRLPIYRKGIAGDWKNELTVAQNELFDVALKEKLAGYNIDLMYE